MIEKGTVISGKTQLHHTIPRLLEVVASVEPDLATMLRRKHRLPREEDWYEGDGGQAMFDEVSGILSGAAAPYGLYFGSHPSGSAPLGFWPIPEDCAFWRQETASSLREADFAVDMPPTPHTMCGNCVMCIEAAAHPDNGPNVARLAVLLDAAEDAGFDSSKVQDDGTMTYGCSKCSVVIISGRACHETGCPSMTMEIS